MERRRVRASAPPMEWPIRKRGVGGGVKERMKLRMSERTRGVGPVRPAEEGVGTERPQPRWSKPWIIRL